MVRSLAYGLLPLILANLSWPFILQLESFGALSAAIWVAPVAASFLASYVAPRRKILIGLSMTLPAVVLPVISNAAYQLAGHRVDYSGAEGAMLLAMMIAPFTLLLCCCGTVVGYWFSGRKRSPATGR